MAILEEPIKEVLTLRNYVGGEWVKPKGKVIDVVNPTTCKLIANSASKLTSNATD